MSLLKTIDKGTLANAKRDRRQYIGASNIGNRCLAALQYSLRGYPQKSVPAGVLRIFEIGHIIEEIVVSDLKKAGFKVLEVDPETNKQWEVTCFGGHVRGHADGIISTDANNPYPAILEIKSMNDKKWGYFKAQGIRHSHPIYYSQMQLLMGLSGITTAWLVAYNKNNSAYHAEQVDFDEKHYNELIEKARLVVREQKAVRVSNNPLAFECRYCNFRPHCWPNGEEELTMPFECITCAYAKPTGNRQWYCTKHGTRATEPCEHWRKVTPEPAND